MKRVWLVAAREYLCTVRRKGFIVATLGMPLLFIAILGVSGAAQYFAFRSTRMHSESIGIVDEAGLVKRDLLDKIQSSTPSALARKLDAAMPQTVRDQAQREVKKIGGMLRFKFFSSRQQAHSELLGESLRAFYVVPEDYVERGEIELEMRKGGFMSDDRPGWQVVERLVRASLVEGKVERLLGERLWLPARLKSVTITETGQPETRGELSVVADFVVPYVFTLLFLMSILGSAGYLLQSVAEEKENRVIEILLSSVTPEQLLGGKVLGLCGAGLTQLAVWILIGIAPAVWLLPFLHVRASLLLIALVFFILGFLLFGTLMAGFGSLGNNVKESQQMALVWTMSSVIPLFFMTLLLAQPNGTFARVMSYIPLTAPLTIMLRTSAASVPWWDVTLSAAILLVSLFVFIRLAARMFRLGILLYGKRPTFVEIFRWLRAA